MTSADEKRLSLSTPEPVISDKFVAGNPLRMLIVDESFEDQSYIARLFENLGVEMDWATSGTQALRKMHLGFDLVITALSTADMDGLDLLLRIKQLDVHVEVIVTGRDSSEETISQVMRQGAFCYLTKPFLNKNAVVKAIRRALDRRRETRKEEALYRSIILGQTTVVDSKSGPLQIGRSKTGVPAEDLLSLMNDGFVFLDENGRISFANVKFSRKLSFPYHSVLSKLFVMYVLREDRDAFSSFLAQIEQSRTGILETRMVNRTGRIMHVMLTARGFEGRNAPAETLLVVTDITDKRRAEERARMLATLVERARFEAILVYDNRGRIIHCNKAAQVMFGYPSNKLVGTSMEVLFQRDEEEERITLVSTEPGDAAYELIGVHFDGTHFPVEVSESADKGDDNTDVGLLFARDITKRKAAEKELLRANEKLTAVNAELMFLRDAQKRFFANMSHELKTPLNTIGGYAGLMLEGVGGNLSEKHLKWAESIKRQSAHLLLIIQEILAFAKLDKNETELSLKPIRPESVILETATAAVALLGRKSIQVITETDDGPPAIVTDPYLLRQVVMNLVSNAVKFTEKGSITIGVHAPDPLHASFYVSDTGVGIAESEIDKIFNDFYQIEGVEIPNPGGCGLGLSIVRRLVERLSGAVRVESEKGNGAKFIVTLPLDPSV